MDDNKQPNPASEPERRTAPPLSGESEPTEQPVDEVAVPAESTSDKPDSSPGVPATDEPVSDEALLAADASTGSPGSVTVSRDSSNPFRKFFRFYGRHKKWTIPLTIVIILAILGGVPWTRYRIAALAVKQDYTVVVTDNSTRQPVSNAVVKLDNISVKTDNEGRATLHVKVGPRTLNISKKYYRSRTEPVVVPIAKQKSPQAVRLTATGRQVRVTITNKINGQPVGNALVRVADTEAKTDKAGQAALVLPAGHATADARFSASGYNDGTGVIHISGKTTLDNKFQLTPTGKVYFLSNLSGKIDVVKTNLDGSGRQTVLAGTGSESDSDTSLLAARDWQYLALEASRNHADTPALYLITPSSHDKLTVIDDGNADFTPVGWAGHYFIYQASKHGFEPWQAGANVIESYDADTGKTVVLASSKASGTNAQDAANENFYDVVIFNNRVVYTRTWNGPNGYVGVPGQQDSLAIVDVDGSNGKTLKTSDASSSEFANLELTKPDTLYISMYTIGGGATTFLMLDSQGTLTSSNNMTNDLFYRAYPTYLLSPSGTQTFWSEPRDGKNSLFVGDASGLNGKQIASLSDYAPYGWYSADYLLVSKDSVLYVMPVTGGTPLKITDYHRTNQDYHGYGYGYGGL